MPPKKSTKKEKIVVDSESESDSDNHSDTSQVSEKEVKKQTKKVTKVTKKTKTKEQPEEKNIKVDEEDKWSKLSNDGVNESDNENSDNDDDHDDNDEHDEHDGQIHNNNRHQSLSGSRVTVNQRGKKNKGRDRNRKSVALDFSYNDYLSLNTEVSELSNRDLLRVLIARTASDGQVQFCKTLKDTLRATNLECDFPKHVDEEKLKMFQGGKGRESHGKGGKNGAGRGRTNYAQPDF